MAEAKVFREFTQAELDAEYSPRLTAPDFQSYFDRWAALGVEARKSPRAKLDVAYGPDPTDKVDIFPPAGDGPHPVLIYFHGGFWRRFGKGDRSFIAPHMNEAGVMLVSVDYALLPTVTMDDLVAQCRRAVIWIARHIAEFGGDPARLYIAGESAGGHLTATMAATDWVALEGAGSAPSIRGALAISGVYDLEPIPLTYLQPEVRLTPEHVARHSPARHVIKVPTQVILAVGLKESAEFQRQMTDYSAAFVAAGIRHDLVRCGDRNHFSILDALCEPRHQLHLALMRLMRPTAR